MTTLYALLTCDNPPRPVDYFSDHHTAVACMELHDFPTKVVPINELLADLSPFQCKTVEEALLWAADCGWLPESSADDEEVYVPAFLITRAHALLRAHGVNTQEVGDPGTWDPDTYQNVARILSNPIERLTPALRAPVAEPTP